jgi:DMSO/TMAO reductase YedYZ molybdopterin-dependent catalytic subunit
VSEDRNPFFDKNPRAHSTGLISREELALANRNSGIFLEALQQDITPAGMHYLLVHFDVPHIAAADWRLDVSGLVERPLTLTLDDIRALPAVTMPVTLECAGNGRIAMSPRTRSMPWCLEAVGTAEWTGTPLHHVLDQAGLSEDTVEIAFFGADRGFDRAIEHDYGRSLTPDKARAEEVMLVYEMNGMPLLPQHGFPMRLIVPGWYGMASVKWLTRIEALDHAFQGHQQVGTYRYRENSDDPGRPVDIIRVRSLMTPPGIPDWFTRRRMVEAGPVEIAGRAWSGAGVAVERVEFGVDGVWQDATLHPRAGEFAWSKWSCTWHAEPGDHVLACRATDANGAVQPLEPVWDNSGFGNNVVQEVAVTVR